MKIKYRWIVAALLFFAGMLNYLDRAALSVAAPLIKQDLKIDDAQMGLLFSSFFLGYCVFCFIGGWASDRFGPKRVFGCAAAFWSVFCGLTSLMGNFTQLLICRVLFGIGEGPMGSTTNKTVTNWFPREEAAFALGLSSCGQPLGAAIAAPVVGLVAWHYGWRVSFVVIALLGILWLAAWCLMFKDTPSQHPRVSTEERDLIQSSRARQPVASEAGKHSVWHYIFSVPVLAVAFAYFCSNYVMYFFLTWLPSYLTDYQHLDVKSMSIIGMIPWVGAAIGFLAGGTVSDYILRRTGKGVFARKSILILGLAVAAASVLMVSRTSDLTSAVVFITLGNLFLFMSPQLCWILLQEIVPAEHIGGTGGFVHLLANLAGLLAPALTGYVVQYGGGYNTAFMLASIAAASGAVVVLLVVKGRKAATPVAPTVQVPSRG